MLCSQEKNTTRRRILVSVAEFVNTFTLENHLSLEPAAGDNSDLEPDAEDASDEVDVDDTAEVEQQENGMKAGTEEGTEAGMEEDGNRVEEGGTEAGMEEDSNKVDEVGDEVEEDGDKVEEDENRVEEVGVELEEDEDRVEEVGSELEKDGNKVEEVGDEAGTEEDDSKVESLDVPYYRLDPITLEVTSTVDKPGLEAARNGFFAEILALGNQEVKVFVEDDAVKVTNFFFADMMGEKAATRLYRLLHFYSADRKGEANRGAAARAESVAEDESFTLEIRRFFSTFAQAQRTASVGHPEFTAVERFQRHVDLLKEYRGLQAAVKQKDKAILQCLKEAGFEPKRGVRWPSLVTSFVAKQLDLTTVQLQNACQAALGVHKLATRFGPGILCVLPTNAMTK